MIRPANLYYMLAYAFETLREGDAKSLGDEPFDNAADLCAAILAEGLKKQVRQGIRRGYVPETAALTSLRGRVDWAASLKSGGLLARRLVCAYEEFLADIHLNRIIKTTLVWLLKAPIGPKRKTALCLLLPYFKEVRTLAPASINWRIQYDRNTRSYQLLMYICRLVLQGLLQRQADGGMKVQEYLDAKAIHDLYERFVRAYYHRHFPEVKVEKTCIDWTVDDEYRDMLPRMETDVQLTYEKKILIIDTKYYGTNTQTKRHDTSEKSPTGPEKLISQNLYQIFCYVKNKAAEVAGAGQEVSGLLLYALTDGGAISQSYEMSGNRIGARTIDLGGEFSRIRETLDAIAADFLGALPGPQRVGNGSAPA